MSVPHWFLLAGLAVFVLGSAHGVCRIVSSGGFRCLARPKGKPAEGIAYALTGAMMPWRKESASRHPGSYALGVAFHVGTFLSFAWLVVLFTGASLPKMIGSGSVVILAVATVSGILLLAKRIASSDLRHFSNADDYFSNVLVASFQALTALAIEHESAVPGQLVVSGVLLAYLPAGKLRHAIYFFLARVYLGIYYGRRGVWPARRNRPWQA